VIITRLTRNNASPVPVLGEGASKLRTNFVASVFVNLAAFANTGPSWYLRATAVKFPGFHGTSNHSAYVPSLFDILETDFIPWDSPFANNSTKGAFEYTWTVRVVLPIVSFQLSGLSQD
jgi:hypothetical protein